MQINCERQNGKVDQLCRQIRVIHKLTITATVAWHNWHCIDPTTWIRQQISRSTMLASSYSSEVQLPNFIDKAVNFFQINCNSPAVRSQSKSDSHSGEMCELNLMEEWCYVRLNIDYSDTVTMSEWPPMLM